MKMTTICYIEKDNCYLMLHRISKKNDENKDKWIGVGGKFEDKESPEECLLREVKEETGLTLLSYKLRGIITFVSDVAETEYMYLFTANEYTGQIIECNEGKLEWIEKKNLMDLNLWEGDKVFLKLLGQDYPFFSLKLEYSGEKLICCKLDGKEIKSI